MNELNRNDRAAWQEVRSTLDEKVNVDLRENSQFWAGYEGIMEEVSDKVNDTYLKANGQSDGVLSYDRMVNLVVSYYLEQDTSAAASLFAAVFVENEISVCKDIIFVGQDSAAEILNRGQSSFKRHSASK